MSRLQRKTRVTKKEVIAYREEKKNYSSYKSKSNVKPGPWTLLEPGFKVKAELKENLSFVSCIPNYYGTYTSSENWNEKGWYPIIFNVKSENMMELINEHGVDKFIAACEESLNETTDTNNKQLYGDIVILSIHAPNATNPDPLKRFISCNGKTNKKSIKGFTAIRQNKHILL